jgi:hypothetical protein
MFTPRSFSIGDHVKINRDISNSEGTFGAGHEFEIIDLYERHGEVLYDLRDRDLRLLGKVEFADLSWL